MSRGRLPARHSSERRCAGTVASVRCRAEAWRLGGCRDAAAAASVRRYCAAATRGGGNSRLAARRLHDAAGIAGGSAIVLLRRAEVQLQVCGGELECDRVAAG